ncbi:MULTISPECIES: hypothetical protein [Geobacillus]|uniref:Uncharacterized protein n=1 Tax=Geobacillus thermodenitrificans TaxID=33940 RepID=A0ABY9QH16_GEOTD|nr:MULTISPECIES: hypothetical protein [Geobacillus]MEC5188519.1 hypothetical protein [Geobacillus thermodenitrificans]MED3718015.1 hypothetical protein [Geobacillus thermodenitrificans]MED3906546.1 hypothetical protein [Geobacillus thermodenitrificans]MED4918227.1 hypothetical protein [Geobacillus thermodenitrificans]NNU88249.1 hypothetical protein [Geobacillus sp. MR]
MKKGDDAVCERTCSVMSGKLLNGYVCPFVVSSCTFSCPSTHIIERLLETALAIRMGTKQAKQKQPPLAEQ